MLHCGAGGMSEIPSVMRTRAGMVDSGPRAQPSGLTQRYCPGEHDRFYTSDTRGYAFLYALPTYDARGTSRLVRYIEVYVIASQVSMELMLFRRGLSAIVCNNEVYVISRVVISRVVISRVVISRVVISRFDLYDRVSACSHSGCVDLRTSITGS